MRATYLSQSHSSPTDPISIELGQYLSHGIGFSLSNCLFLGMSYEAVLLQALLEGVILDLAPNWVSRKRGAQGVSEDISQTVLALRGSDGFSRDLWRHAGVRPRSLSARSCCKNLYLVTLTFAPLTRNTWSRDQTHKNSMVVVNFSLVPRHDRQAAADAADVCC